MLALQYPFCCDGFGATTYGNLVLVEERLYHYPAALDLDAPLWKQQQKQSNTSLISWQCLGYPLLLLL